MAPPGLSVLIQRGNQREFRRRGVSDMESGAKPTAHRAMRIASMAKAFNGAIALSLVSKGKLELDDTIDDWLPGVWPKAGDVTVRQMLQHTAGAARLHPPTGFHRRPDRRPGAVPVAAGADRLRQHEGPRAHAGQHLLVLRQRQHHRRPDRRGRNRQVLRATLAKRDLPAGRDQRHEPAGHAGAAEGLHARLRPRQERRLPDESKFINPALAWASGGIVSTPLDVNRFFRAYVGGDLFSAKVGRSQRLVRPRSLLSPGPGPQRRHAGAVPLPDTLRRRLRAHRLLPGLPPVRRLERERPPLGRLLGQLPDRPRPGLAAGLGADPPGAGGRGLPRRCADRCRSPALWTALPETGFRG